MLQTAPSNALLCPPYLWYDIYLSVPRLDSYVNFQSCFRLAADVLGLSTDLVRAVNTSAFDFSALHAISGSLMSLLKDVPPIFETLREHVHKFHSLIALSKGRGIFALWARLYFDDVRQDVNHEIQKVETLLKSLPDTSTSSGASDVQTVSFSQRSWTDTAIYLQAFNLMCMKLLPSFLRQDKEVNVTDLQHRLENVRIFSTRS